MKSRMKLLAAVIALSAGGAFAQDKASTEQKEPMASAEQITPKEQTADAEQEAKIDEQVSQLQSQVRSLQQEASEAPKYFDDPLTDPLLP